MSAISFIIEARSENVSKKEVRLSIRGGEEDKGKWVKARARCVTLCIQLARNRVCCKTMALTTNSVDYRRTTPRSPFNEKEAHATTSTKDKFFHFFSGDFGKVHLEAVKH